MNKLFIGIPILNRVDLLANALASIDVLAEVFLVNNNTVDPVFDVRLGELQKQYGFEVRTSRYNLGVAASWNLIIQTGMAYGYDIIYITANDIVLSPGVLAQADAFEKRENECLWMISDFNLFAVHAWRLVAKVGWADCNLFPAYMEDNDLVWRCGLAGMPALRINKPQETGERSPVIGEVRHLGSQTIRSDKEYAEGNNNTFNQWNATHYRMKWGGLPGHEQFKTPYDRKDRDHRWWPDPGHSIEVRDWDNVKRARLQAAQPAK